MRIFTSKNVKSFISECDQGIIATLARMLVPSMELQEPMPNRDAAALLVATINRQREALHAIDLKVQSIKGQGDPNVRRTLEAIDRIIDEAL